LEGRFFSEIFREHAGKAAGFAAFCLSGGVGQELSGSTQLSVGGQPGSNVDTGRVRSLCNFIEDEAGWLPPLAEGQLQSVLGISAAPTDHFRTQEQISRTPGDRYATSGVEGSAGKQLKTFNAISS
jgi:hypothetical protein